MGIVESWPTKRAFASMIRAKATCEPSGSSTRTAIAGRDPQLAKGLDGALVGAIGDFLFILMNNCGHLPWIERAARDRFYAILRGELRQRKGRTD
jgi:hypothetical protein